MNPEIIWPLGITIYLAIGAYIGFRLVDVKEDGEPNGTNSLVLLGVIVSMLAWPLVIVIGASRPS